MVYNEKFLQALKDYINLISRCFLLIFKIIISSGIANESQMKEICEVLPEFAEIK